VIANALQKTLNLRVLPPRGRALPLQKPCVLWFTGLSGAGKSTLAGALKDALDARGCPNTSLDGDVLREGLCSDLGFSEDDRRENIRRVAHVAGLMARANLVVLVTLVSPIRASRDAARALLSPHEFLEVFVDAPLSVVQQRDTKGLYARARAGENIQLTGVQAPYEAPEAPELRIDSSACTPAEARDRLLGLLASRGVIPQQAARVIHLP
jgi:adenylyl-sulfate kinase